MFAKVFSQIFDSSIAEDYNCRRMFMDLLVLADSDGVVDMTQEAISRRTNVPIEEVTKYIEQLCEADPLSRSKVEQGRRIVMIDPNRTWGWQVVNYHHYRKIRDEEARRSYFRSAKRKQRKAERSVKDTAVDSGGRCQTVPSASSSKSSCTKIEAEEFCLSLGLPKSDGEAMFLHWQEKGWSKVKDWRLTIRKWKSFGYLPSQKQGKNGSSTKSRNLSFEDRKKRKGELQEELNAWSRSAPKDKDGKAVYTEKEKVEREAMYKEMDNL